MSSYLSLESFSSLSLMPPEYVDAIEALHPGWLDRQLTRWSAWIDARLAKRYETPFAAESPPAVIEQWLCDIVTARAYLKRGINPNDAQSATIAAEATKAMAEIAEAANSATGLFELPWRADVAGQTAVTRGDPLFYTESSPYSWVENQRDAVGRRRSTSNMIISS